MGKTNFLQPRFGLHAVRLRLSGSLDFFLREGKDLISDYAVPLPPYLYSTITTNVGTTRSTGFELTTNWQAVKTSFKAEDWDAVSYVKHPEKLTEPEWEGATAK